jgi:hypothetical protein
VVECHQRLLAAVLSDLAQDAVDLGLQRLQGVAAGLQTDAPCDSLIHFIDSLIDLLIEGI